MLNKNIRCFIFLALIGFSISAQAETNTYYKADGISDHSGTRQYTGNFPSAVTACKALIPLVGGYTWQYISGDAQSGNCYGKKGSTLYIFGKWQRYIEECPEGTVLENSYCVAPAADPCADKLDQPTSFTKSYPSIDDYSSTCKVSVNGCQVDTCSIGTMECETNGETGEFICEGEGIYTGITSVGTDEPVTNTPPEKHEPLETGSNQSCTEPVTNGATTSYSCITDSNATEYSSSNCSTGEVNGVMGLHCTKPAYVPEHDSKTRTDEVSETTNADGTKTTTTVSTTDSTRCKAGDCSTSSTTTTTTTNTGANGEPISTETICKGAKCDNPTTSEDESEEEKDGVPSEYTPPDASEALPEIGDGEPAPSYAETMESFTDRVSGSPIVSGLSNLTVPTGGTCGLGSLDLFGSSISTSSFCDIAPSVLGGLRYLFLAIWAWAAIRLFFTA